MPHALGASGDAMRFSPLPAVCFPMSAREKKVPEGGGQEKENKAEKARPYPELVSLLYSLLIEQGGKIEVELKGHLTPSWKEV